MLFIIYQGIRKQGIKDLLVLVAALLMLIALFPQEISDCILFRAFGFRME